LNTTPSRFPTRALVLGGGGSAGNAWLIGIVAGLAEAGLDVTDAELIVGTSAGSTAAAQLTGETIFPDKAARAAFGESAMDPHSRPPAALAGFDQGRALAGDLTGFWRR